MTRENKLALIIGFGFILVVGILVSDHFSAASNQESADLSAERSATFASRLDDPYFLHPVHPARPEDESVVEEAAPRRGGPIAANGAGLQQVPPIQSEEARETPAVDPVPPTITNPDLQAIARRETVPADTRWYTIKPGETLASICRREYGSAELWRQLAEINSDRIENPDLIPARVTIRLPKREEMPGAATTVSAPATEAPPAADPPRPRFRDYEVKKGDTLSEIAQELLGTSRRWRELVEANSGVISDPNNVPAGTTIRIPIDS